MRDYLNSPHEERGKETHIIFKDLDNFDKAMKKAFGTVDENRAAEHTWTSRTSSEGISLRLCSPLQAASLEAGPGRSAKELYTADQSQCRR
ncbi:hypothetical protein DCS_06736 [Drechmeria coniospora]|uniref:Uncharacterized protein n=1 Tax=Drechmeria coniospora TaxID=98403 RepID=A0A151GCD7_DRECN|nr:hypothetical protein DCS_06736 [Drechmeria coniospora]KYK54776.1 hypothetical protein DCS_06736 [Drechmeria coniospora]